jgi:hypothetical protein
MVALPSVKEHLPVPGRKEGRLSRKEGRKTIKEER